jgi:TRAP transporter TAXI family solute receptor
MKRKGLVICALAVGAAAMAGAAFGEGANQGLNIAIATGGTGGVYYPLGGGMANVLSKYVPGVQATARVTGGSVDNLKLIGSQQSEVALVMVDAALDALKGEDKFKGSPVEVRTLMVLYRRRRIGQRAQGPQDRRLLLGRRVADRRGDRSRRDAEREDQADRPRRYGQQNEREVQQPLFDRRDPGEDLSGSGQG